MFTQTIEEMRQATKLAKMSTPSAVGKGILSGKRYFKKKSITNYDT